MEQIVEQNEKILQFNKEVLSNIEITQDKSIDFENKYAESNTKDKEEKIPERSLEAPGSERSLTGQQIGLTESLKTNTQVIKHMLKGSKLKICSYTIGTEAQTEMNLFYIENLVDKEILHQVKATISQFKVKYMLHPSVLIEELQAKGTGLSPTVQITERFDIIGNDLLQGKMVIIADNTPIAIIAPIVFWGLFQTQDEYYSSYGRLSNRIMRLIGFLLTMYLPAFYIATQRFHMEDIKKLPIGKHKTELINKFLYTGEILNGFWEMIFILFVLRIIYDTSLHIYKSLNLMITLLAVMIVGQYAVSTKIISSGGLIVGGFAQLCVYLVLVKGLLPMAATMRWVLIPIGWFFGYTGLIAAFLVFFIWGASLKPFGIHYFAPLIPFRPHEWKDTFWRGKLKQIVNSEHKYRMKK
ncbi:spore germination protein [Neobacillus ginsengisoli]|uniref:Spore germination protein n=1 Tax=Neobacillus ginsengisoli TaxID=904295 RepID=A0ABT9Y3F0_9BACI|nr:spore germination protein [Neobacillus ginsengisoli]MDQ0202284.1 hypothetical protein [Neobacillus ginsengisoli]